MIKSMTGYGRAQFKVGSDHYMIELHSINKKSLDIHINMPKEFLSLDLELRRWVHAAIERGQVTLKVFKEGGLDLQEIFPSLEVLKAIKHEWEGYAKGLGYSSEEVTLTFLAEQAINFPHTQGVNLEEAKVCLKKGFDEVVLAFNRMREEEGKSLKEELDKRLEGIKQSLTVINKKASSSSLVMKKKLEEKLKEFNLLSPEGEERLQRDIVLYAEKVDYTEEVVRLLSHIQQFQESLNNLKSGLGKTLEFLTLEMNRETHTITSKSQDLDVTKEALSIKIELEKIREQIQNIQ